LSRTHPAEPRRAIRVLHVEGATAQLELVKAFLEGREGAFEVKSVRSPRDALETLRAGSFDCVVSEFRLQGMDGLMLLRRIREEGETPFILFTAWGNEDVAAGALSLGADAYVRKHGDTDDLRLLARRIRWAVDSRRQRREGAFTSEMLQILNTQGHLSSVLNSAVEVIMRFTDVEAVGIRLREGEDYPYYVFEGFSDGHILKENALCAHDLEEQLMRDGVGNPVLECMCGNIIRGRFDPSKPFFTEGGSFWTNSTSELLVSTTEADRLARTRNTCNTEGYESVALIPIRMGYEVFGLIQLNDTAPGRFDLETIRFLESLGKMIGVVLARVYASAGLEESVERYRSLLKGFTDPVFIVDPDDFSIVDLNGPALVQSDPALGEIRRRTCHEVIAGRNQSCDAYDEACPIIELLEHGGSSSVKLTRQDKYGLVAHLEESAHPIRSVDGSLELCLLVARDVADARFESL
jgi:CheY-like chemotaxis protein